MAGRARRFLAGIRASGLDRIGSPDRPTLLVANHSSWWDAVLPIVISFHHFDHDAYGVMEKKQLDKYRFFSRIGMMEIDRTNPRSAVHTLRSLADLMRDSGRILWYFPQGRLVPNDRRPIAFERGIARLLTDIPGAQAIPVAFRYELHQTERPLAFCRIGESIDVSRQPTTDERTLTGTLEARLSETLDELRREILNQELDNYEWIVRGRRSINERWDSFRGLDDDGRLRGGS